MGTCGQVPFVLSRVNGIKTQVGCLTANLLTDILYFLFANSVGDAYQLSCACRWAKHVCAAEIKSKICLQLALFLAYRHVKASFIVLINPVTSAALAPPPAGSSGESRSARRLLRESVTDKRRRFVRETNTRAVKAGEFS